MQPIQQNKYKSLRKLTNKAYQNNTWHYDVAAKELVHNYPSIATIETNWNGHLHTQKLRRILTSDSRGWRLSCAELVGTWVRPVSRLIASVEAEVIVRKLGQLAHFVAVARPMEHRLETTSERFSIKTHMFEILPTQTKIYNKECRLIGFVISGLDV